MQTRSSDENSVCPTVSVRRSLCLSVRLSNAWIVTKRKKNLSRFFILYERSFSIVSWEKEWLVGATPSTFCVTCEVVKFVLLKFDLDTISFILLILGAYTNDDSIQNPKYVSEHFRFQLYRLDLTWFIPRPRERFGPHSDAILVCWELPPLSLPKWVPFIADLSWLCLSSLSLADRVPSWNLGPPSIVFDVWCGDDPSVSYDRASAVFYSWGCSVCFVVQSWP